MKKTEKILCVIIDIMLFFLLLGVAVDRIEQWKDKKILSQHVPCGIYDRYFKRPIDFMLSSLALIMLSPIMLITAIMVKANLGSPILFKQKRPGLNGEIFELWKFRTMTEALDSDGYLLPDSDRLTDFGKKLRSTSIDELPELFNIIKGEMAIVGPRPQLIRDMVFMNEKQRRRHTVRPGLSGLAQVRGRNALSWEQKLNIDLEYIEKITFLQDAGIILKTIIKVFKCEDITDKEHVTALDYGDYLLSKNMITKEKFNELQAYAKRLE